MYKKLIITIALIISISLSIFTSLLTPTSGQPPVPCTITIVPSETDVEVCTDFTVDVNIVDFYEFPVWDYEFWLLYDPTQMTPNIAYDGDFLTEPVIFGWDASTPGQVGCVGATLQPGPGATGSGTLATVEFHCDAPGTWIFDLLYIAISDEIGQMYMPDTVIPSVPVNQQAFPPDPPPEDLELHPRDVVILGDPTGTQWHELYPSLSNYFQLTSWEPSSVLGPHDRIDMYTIEPPTMIWVETGFVDPFDPFGSEWHELEPTFCQWWVLTSWEDNNGDGFLSPSDQIDMINLDTGEVVWFHVQWMDPPPPEPGPCMMWLDVKYFFQVDEVTVDLLLTSVVGAPQIFVDYKCGYWTFDPENPVCTKWNEIDPDLGPIRCMHLSGWEDLDLDGKLSANDLITMTPLHPYSGPAEAYYVDDVKLTMILTPEPSPPVVPPPPVGPIYLESEIGYYEYDLENPVCTFWHEIYPVYSRIWHLSSWENSLALNPSDLIVLTLKDEYGVPIPGTEAEYHVDKVTVSMNLTSLFDGVTHIVKYEGSLKQFVMYYWTRPITTQWHEVFPEYCRQWHILEWMDQGSGYIDYCDLVLMIDKNTGWIEEFHVESLSTDIYVTMKTHDVAVTNVTCPKTVACEGMCNVTVSVTVENEGDYTETFNVTAKANTTIIDTAEITLNPGENTTLTFEWNTTGATKYADYLLNAEADVVPGETDTADNTFDDGIIIITIPGDINGDRKCDMLDIFQLILHYGCEVGQPCYVANCDINCDGKIDLLDIFIAILHYGEEYP